MILVATIGASQKKWVQAIQERIGITSTVLRSMRSVRMIGLADHTEGVIQSQRFREIDLGKKFRAHIVWLLAVCK
jgi:hypothetical protein